MSLDMESFLDFCIACDRQTEDGQLYCSEGCRLAEFEKTSSNPSSTASSPRCTGGMSSWPPMPSRMPLFLEPAFDFQRASTARGLTKSLPTYSRADRPPSQSPFALLTTLTPATAYASLPAPPPSAEAPQLSAESRKALRAYASAFDQSRYARRQST